MQDAWRAYLELALGLTEASRRKAEQVARDLLKKGGATASQMQSVVEELVSTSRANREELAKLVRYEVDRALGAVGLATAEDIAQLTSRVRQLERRLAEQPAVAVPPPSTDEDAGQSGAPSAADQAAQPAAAESAAAARPAKKVAKKAVKKTTVKKAVKRAPTKATKQPGPGKAAG